MEDDSIDMEDDLKMTVSIWKMTVSIWEMTVSIWDILSLWLWWACEHGCPQDEAAWVKDDHIFQVAMGFSADALGLRGAVDQGLPLVHF